MQIAPDESEKVFASDFGILGSITTDHAGNNYAIDYRDCSIVKITPSGLKETILRSLGTSPLDGPVAMYVGNPSQVFVTMQKEQQVRKYVLSQ